MDLTVDVWNLLSMERMRTIELSGFLLRNRSSAIGGDVTCRTRGTYLDDLSRIEQTFELG